jgi:hypothetical protein
VSDPEYPDISAIWLGIRMTGKDISMVMPLHIPSTIPIYIFFNRYFTMANNATINQE